MIKNKLSKGNSNKFMNATNLYSIYGIPIKVVFPEQHVVLPEIHILLRDLGFIPYSDIYTLLRERIIVTISERDPPNTDGFKKIMQSRIYNATAFCKDDKFLLTNGRMSFVIHPKDSMGNLYLGKKILIKDRSSRQLILGGISELLRWQGLHSLHACGVSKGGLKLLLMGNSGCGKSTCALSLVIKGWSFLSDDIVLIKKSNGYIDVLPTHTNLKFDPEIFRNTRSQYGDKEHIGEYFSRGRESVINIATVYPKQIIPHLYPNVIVFLKIVKRRKSIILRIDQRLALFKLINQSMSLFMGGIPSQNQLNVLNVLATNTTPFQLLMGQDLYENPLKISNISSNIKISLSK